MLTRRLDAVAAVAAHGRAAWHRGRRALRSEERPIDRSLAYAALWREAAEAVGARAVDLPGGFTELRRDGASVRVYGGLVPVDDPVTLELAGNKTAATRLLRAAGIPTPDHCTVDAQHLGPARELLERCGEVVVKPGARTGGGIGVVTHVRDGRQLRRAVAAAASYGGGVVVEEQVAGDASRLLYLDGDLLDAVLRLPARVTGDGRRNVRALVVAENERRQALGGAATGLLPTGLDLRTTLAAQGLDPRHVPAAGVAVRVSGRSNTGGVADSRSVTATVHDEVRAVGALAARTLGVRLAGVDVITTDLSAPLVDTGGVVNEVNTTPGLHWHHLVADGSPATPVLAQVADRLLGAPPPRR